MANNEDVILNMLTEVQKSSTDISKSESPDNLYFKRDEDGVLWSYDKTTNEKVGRIYEHGNNKGSVAKTFGDLI